MDTTSSGWKFEFTHSVVTLGYRAYNGGIIFYIACEASCGSRIIDVPRVRILVQVTINFRLLIGRDGHLDQS